MAKKTSRKTARPAAPRKKSAGKMAASKASTNVLVVNMIPRALSGESHQDSEPTIAVNPANPLHIAGSAFTPDPGGGNLAPIFVSVDGGNTWTLKSIVPSSAADGSATADITLAFGTASNKLYAGIIRLPFPPGRPRLNILRTDNFQSGATMKVLVDRTGKGIDQRYVQAATVLNGPDQGKAVGISATTISATHRARPRSTNRTTQEKQALRSLPFALNRALLPGRTDRRYVRQYIRTGPFTRSSIHGSHSTAMTKAQQTLSSFATTMAATAQTNSRRLWTAGIPGPASVSSKRSNSISTGFWDCSGQAEMSRLLSILPTAALSTLPTTTTSAPITCCMFCARPIAV